MINDVKNLKESGSASVAELRAFLKSLKARNPQEVIGIVSTSLLVQSLVISCVATVVMMGVFTVGPYMIYGPNKPPTPGGKPGAAATAATNANRPVETATAPDTKATSSSPGTTDLEKASKVMGLDESKRADPKKNPLDKPDLDKLLDGL